MATRQAESTHDEVRHSSTENGRAVAEAEQDHPIHDVNAPGVESPSADQMQGANGLPRQSAPHSDQDIDTAGTEADEQSPTRNLFLALTPSLQRG